MEYKATKKSLELACEEKVSIQDGRKTTYLIKGYLWLWDNEHNILVVVIRQSDHKVMYKSKDIKRAEESFGVKVEDFAKKMKEGEKK